jgi:branched-chain amino acid transport system permease protein
LLGGVRAAIPALFLFAALLLSPQAQLRIGQIKGISGVPVPSVRRALISGAGLIVVVAVLALAMAPKHTDRMALGLILGIVMLSLVPLTGYGGYVSLTQFTFVGIGAIVVARLDSPSPLAILAGAVAAALVGVLVALPALRLQGLYLALSTLAFGLLMDKLVFQADFAFGFNGSLEVPRLALPGVSLDSPEAYAILSAVVFTLVGLGVLALRRSRYGRILLAMRDSPVGCATLGLNLRWTRVRLFGLSAGIAGLAGGLFGGLNQSVAATDFQLFNSLPLLLLAVVAGVTSVSGSAIGGMVLMLLPVVAAEFAELGGIMFLAIGVAALGLGRDPNGVASRLFALGRWRPGAGTKPSVPFRRSVPAYATGSASVSSSAHAGAHVSPAAEPATSARSSREGKW